MVTTGRAQGRPPGAAQAPRCSLAAARQCIARRLSAATAGRAAQGRRSFYTVPIRLRARPVRNATQRNAAQREPQFAGPTPRSRRGAPTRLAKWFCPRQGRRAAHASACAGARSARPDQMPASPPQGASGQPSAAQPARAAGVASRRSSIRRSRPLLRRQSWPRRRRARIPGLRGAPHDPVALLPSIAVGKHAAQPAGAPSHHRARRRTTTRAYAKQPAGGLRTSRTAPRLRGLRGSGPAAAQDVRAHSGPPWPWPCPALAVACTSAESARPECAVVTTLSRRGAVCGCYVKDTGYSQAGARCARTPK